MVRGVKFEISEEKRGNAVTLVIAGELDLETAPKLADRVAGEIAAEVATLTLDLAELTFMDSSGLRLLIELDQQAAGAPWSLTLRAPKHAAARTVLRLTGADAALPFEEEAP